MGNIFRFFFGLGILLLWSCDHGSVYSGYQSVNDSWGKGQSVDFTFQSPDTLKAYNMFINLRNDNDYPFSNLFLIVKLNFRMAGLLLTLSNTRWPSRMESGWEVGLPI